MLSICLPAFMLIQSTDAKANSLNVVQSGLNAYWAAVEGPRAKQTIINNKWFDKALVEERVRIGRWSNNNQCGTTAAPQEDVAIKAATSTIQAAKSNFEKQSNLLLATGGDQGAYNKFFHDPALANTRGFLDIPEPAGGYEGDWSAELEGSTNSIMYAGFIRGMLRQLALRERGAPSNPIIIDPELREPPPSANAADPLATRPKVFWLSKAILQCRKISGSNLDRNKKKALYDQKKAARILTRASAGFFDPAAKDINGHRLFSGDRRSLATNQKVTSKLVDICEKGGGWSDTTYLNYVWSTLTADINQVRGYLNSLNRISANEPGSINLGTKVQGMFAIPTAEIQLSDRTWKPTLKTARLQRISDRFPDQKCIIRE